jgi:hypothetical protein
MRIKTQAIYLFKSLIQEKNLYFLDNKVHEWTKDFSHQENGWEKFTRMSFRALRNTEQDEAKSNSSNKEAIAMKNV